MLKFTEAKKTKKKKKKWRDITFKDRKTKAVSFLQFTTSLKRFQLEPQRILGAIDKLIQNLSTRMNRRKNQNNFEKRILTKEYLCQ